MVVGMIPDLDPLGGGELAWLMLLLKTLAAMGFMTAANFVVLYAC
jgi:hypothetical protein